MQPLRAHAATCDRCSAELEAARFVVEALDDLPHFSPSPLFAERVMARTHVFQPWHVAAMDTARRFVPEAGPARVLVGVAASSVALMLTVLSVFLVTRLDALLFLGQLLLQRARESSLGVVDGIASTLLGDAGLGALSANGVTGIGVAVVAVLVSGALAAGGLRAAVAVSRRNR